MNHLDNMPYRSNTEKTKWTASSEFGTYRLCEQRRLRRACASAQSHQNLRCSLIQTGTFRQKARSLAPLNGWACAVKICHDGMLEDTNSLDGAQISVSASLQIVDSVYMYTMIVCSCILLHLCNANKYINYFYSIAV